MADTELPERKPRKSVAFAEGQTIVDENGDVTESSEQLGRKSSAESHAIEGNGDVGEDKQVDEMTAMFDGLAKKKKKKPSKKEDGAEGEGEKDAEPAGDGEVDLSALKKKKKKPKKTTEDDFEAKLAEAGATEDNQDEESSGAGRQETNVESGVQDGDIHGGTGIWQHDSTKPVNYESLLSRFFVMLHDSHPDLASSGDKRYKIPPPQCLREGNKKTIFANIADICKRMKRTDEHVTQFLFAELGTSGSVDGSRRLVIKGRFQQKQIENVLRRYIFEYVTCKTCRSPDTELNKGENRLYFVTCNSCGSRRSVTAIKTGFSAQVGKRKRQQG
ncbi:translation initiation factor eIF-2 beta subunit [Extremus antarcticus]|uniref:Translation initiation factor eIF-2 beta subunit n=1 Tax=Extremus antarcticus TaxID=702011 RepID=A0AAJ0DIW9_9PEZI|nr:translation initiation factor eIF-2 beta subunit [Extremus antarcticus]